jgi:2-polyprenyl-6-methoxyphenol hydroxylase-like FAD-dependent oxidoreductase
MRSDVVHYQNGDFLADGPTRLSTYYATRPLFEQIVRRRVAALEDVEVRSNTRCVDYLLDGDGTTVEGVLVRDGTSKEVALPADLVVDATGRTSKTPTWLEDNGYAAPPLDEVRIDVAYSTVVIERPTDDRRVFFVAADPPRTRGAGVFPVEDGRWVATFFGVHGDHPPTDAEGLEAFAASLPGPDLERLLDARSWVSDDVAHYPFPSNRRYRYEALDRFPNGLVVVGDAISSFNPIYGQGMSVAAFETLLLHHALVADGEGNLGLRFFDRAEEPIDVAWNMAAGADFGFSRTEGPKPAGTDLFNWYVGRLIRNAHTDGKLREAFYRVFNMEQPPTSLFRPGTAWRVLRPTWPGTDTSTDTSTDTAPRHASERSPRT